METPTAFASQTVARTRTTASDDAAFRKLTERIQAHAARQNMTPEEIDREIREARREARQERRARGR